MANSYTGDLNEPYNFNDFKNMEDEREDGRFFKEDKAGTMEDVDPFGRQSGFERQQEPGAGSRKAGRTLESLDHHREESRQRHQQQQEEAQQVTGFFKPLQESQDQRTRGQRSQDNDSRERPDQAFEDQRPPLTLTQDSVTHAIGPEYLTPNAREDVDDSEPQGPGLDVADQAQTELEELAYGAHRRDGSDRNGQRNHYQEFDPHHLETDEPFTPGRLPREGARSKRSTMALPGLDFIKEELTQEQFHEVYVFVDQVPISKIKRNLNRDFSDGSLAAEVISYNLPPNHKSLIQVHNYISTHQIKQKRANWQLLNRKVLSKLGRRAGFSLTDEQIEGIVHSKYGYVERALLQIKYAMEIFKERPTPIPDIAKSTFVPAGDYNSKSCSRSQNRTTHNVDFVQQNISNLVHEGGGSRSARSSARMSPGGPALSARGNKARKRAQPASHSLIDFQRAQAEPQAQFATERRLYQRKKRKLQLMSYRGLGSTPQPLQILADNNSNQLSGLAGKALAAQKLKMSQSALQLENFNNTMSVMAGARAVTPAASSTNKSNYDNSAHQVKRRRKDQKLHKSALSLQDLPQNSKSFTGTIRSAHHGQQGPSSREAQGESLMGSLQVPILNSQRRNYLRFQEYQVDFLKRKKREEAERKSSARPASQEYSKHLQSTQSLIKAQPAEARDSTWHGSLPLPGMKGNLNAKKHKNFASVRQQKPSPSLEFPKSSSNQPRPPSKSKELPMNAVSIQSVPQVQNASTHSFNPRGIKQQADPGPEVNEDCINILDDMKKPMSPSFRHKQPPAGSGRGQKQQSSGSKAQGNFENHGSTTSPNSLRKMARMMGQNSHGAAAAASNPSFNNYSQADANSELNETLNGNDGRRRASKGPMGNHSNQQAKEGGEHGLMRELEECHAVITAQEEHIEHLQQTVEIMREKMEKMNQLLLVKDQKIENLRKDKAAMQFGDGMAAHDVGPDPQRSGRSTPLATPSASGADGLTQPGQQHFKHMSGLSISQISKSGISNGQQMNQGGPGGMQPSNPTTSTPPFTPVLAGQGEESSVVIVAAEPDTSNDIAALFQQNSQINLVTNSNAQSRQRGGGRSTSQRASEGASQPTVQYAHIHQDTRPEEEVPEAHDFRDNFSPNFMTMDEYNSSKKPQQKSSSRKTPSQLRLQSLERARVDKNQRPAFGQNKQSFGGRGPQLSPSSQHAQSQAQGQAFPRGIEAQAPDDAIDLKRHFRSIKSDQVADSRLEAQPKSKPNHGSRLKPRNQQTAAQNRSKGAMADPESKIPYYLRRDQKFFSMKDL